MSKRIEANITCPNCGNQFPFTLFRSIWGEYPENRELVMTDRINVATCSSCNKSIKLPYPFFYTNAKQFFAVWWEPEYDSQIDKDAMGYSKMLGSENYLAAAPRIKDWNEFKETILRFEKGELRGKLGVIGKQMQDQMEGFPKNLTEQNKKKQNNGCFGMLIILIMLSGTAALSISKIIF
jgi:predicted RNA-binding Zn-ribbon protein involved in translation (DUF1610 family)